jgi:ribose transport system substrate-binding protein
VNRKLLAGIATAALAALTLAGCTAESDQPASNGDDGAIKIAAFSAGYATPPIKYAMDTFTERAEAEGWEVDVYTTNDDFDTLNGYMQQQLTAGYDAYFMTGVDPRPLATGLTQATEAGIPVFAIDADVQPNDAFTLNVASDQNDLAGLSVQELDAALGGLNGKNVAIVTFDPALSIAARTALAEEELTKAGANIVATHKVPNIAAAVDSTLGFVKDYVQANPGELDAIWSGLDPAAIGAFQGIVESGEDIALVSSDAMGATVDMIAGGGPFVASVKQDWSVAIDTLLGEMSAFFEDGSVSTNFISVPGELVTADNAGTVITYY